MKIKEGDFFFFLLDENYLWLANTQVNKEQSLGQLTVPSHELIKKSQTFDINKNNQDFIH